MSNSARRAKTEAHESYRFHIVRYWTRCKIVSSSIAEVYHKLTAKRDSASTTQQTNRRSKSRKLRKQNVTSCSSEKPAISDKFAKDDAQPSSPIFLNRKTNRHPVASAKRPMENANNMGGEKNLRTGHKAAARHKKRMRAFLRNSKRAAGSSRTSLRSPLPLSNVGIGSGRNDELASNRLPEIEAEVKTNNQVTAKKKGRPSKASKLAAASKNADGASKDASDDVAAETFAKRNSPAKRKRASEAVASMDAKKRKLDKKVDDPFYFGASSSSESGDSTSEKPPRKFRRLTFASKAAAPTQNSRLRPLSPTPMIQSLQKKPEANSESKRSVNKKSVVQPPLASGCKRKEGHIPFSLAESPDSSNSQKSLNAFLSSVVSPANAGTASAAVLSNEASFSTPRSLRDDSLISAELYTGARTNVLFDALKRTLSDASSPPPAYASQDSNAAISTTATVAASGTAKHRDVTSLPSVATSSNKDTKSADAKKRLDEAEAASSATENLGSGTTSASPTDDHFRSTTNNAADNDLRNLVDDWNEFTAAQINHGSQAIDPASPESATDFARPPTPSTSAFKHGAGAAAAAGNTKNKSKMPATPPECAAASTLSLDAVALTLSQEKSASAAASPSHPICSPEDSLEDVDAIASKNGPSSSHFFMEKEQQSVAMKNDRSSKASQSIARDTSSKRFPDTRAWTPSRSSAFDNGDDLTDDDFFSILFSRRTPRAAQNGAADNDSATPGGSGTQSVGRQLPMPSTPMEKKTYLLSRDLMTRALGLSLAQKVLPDLFRDVD